jgi:DNA polymerase III delta prime subunit
VASSNFEQPTLRELVRALSHPRLTIGLAGPPGVGKTSLLYAVGKRLRKPYIGKVQCHNELSPGEVMGIPMPGIDEQWSPGPGSLSYEQGGMLILDELDKLSGACKTYAYAWLDRGPGGKVDYIGRTFAQAKGYQAVATMNEDPKDGSLPDAMLDRFDAWFFIYKPHEALLKMLDPDLRVLCIKAYDGAVDPMVGPPFTFRMFLGYQTLRTAMSPQKALIGATYGNERLAQSMLETLLLAESEQEEEDDEPEDDEDEGEEEEDEDEDDEDEDDD